MSAKNDGGGAFPVECNGYVQPGMTLRDWFAGQAIAWLTCPPRDFAFMAREAYLLADAMLKERDK